MEMWKMVRGAENFFMGTLVSIEQLPLRSNIFCCRNGENTLEFSLSTDGNAEFSFVENVDW